MNVLKKLSEAASGKPYHGFAKLKTGYHEVLFFRISVGKYGRSVVAELENEVIFLPQFISEKITESDIDDLNTSKEKLFLFFGGKHDTNKHWIVRLLSQSQMLIEKKNNKKSYEMETDTDDSRGDYDCQSRKKTQQRKRVMESSDEDVYADKSKPVKKKKKYVLESSLDEEND